MLTNNNDPDRKIKLCYEIGLFYSIFSDTLLIIAIKKMRKLVWHSSHLMIEMDLFG
tara:strand:- start:12 stop:179 length:168 start_codon:yes stop_codon:yes gene_type:complete